MSRSVGEHVAVREGSIVNNTFKVLKEVGCGNFAKVYKCVDMRQPNATPVAVKILKREYAGDAAFEKDILKALAAKDSKGHRVVRMLDYFVWMRCPCFVFSLRGPTLRSRKLGVARGHVTMADIRRFSVQMLETLAFLHDDIKMVHTDLKPENILLDSDAVDATAVGDGWTMADFGSASFYNPAKPDSDLISTRPYRAPEVVLSLPWGPKADVWSIACIIFEMFHGARLFETNDDADHMALFQRRTGKRMPTALVRQSRQFRRFFDDSGALLRPPRMSEPGPRLLSEVLKTEPEFHDFLLGMLEQDSARRISAAEALRHPFLTGSRASSHARRSSSPLPRDVAAHRELPRDIPRDVPRAPLAARDGLANAQAMGGKPSMHVPVISRHAAAVPSTSRGPSSSRAPSTHRQVMDQLDNQLAQMRVQVQKTQAVPAAGRPSPRYGAGYGRY